MRLITLLAFILIAVGCESTPPYSADGPLYDDVIWRGQATQDLAYDFRCDGKFDFEAYCAPRDTQDRLSDLEEVPESVLKQLQSRAERINQSWDGK